MSPFERPKVIVFSDHLLYPSETFIEAQAGALKAFEPVFAGSRRVAGLDLPKERVHVINQGNISGKCRELFFKLTGVAPDLVKRLGSLSPVLLHAHYGPNGFRGLALARSLRIPLVVTFHGSDATLTDLRYQKTHPSFRYYLANKDKLKGISALFLTVSQFVRRKLLEQGFPEERVLVHYTGVDTRKFQPSSTESRPLILFVGRLVEFKGAEFLIHAAAEVQIALPTAELVLIGDGPLRDDLEKLAKRSLRRYRFLGAQTSEEVRDWMNRASVVCMPSITTRSGECEGFGMVCAEAQAVGKPVVAFNSGGLSEIVCHTKTGFLAAEGDWRALSEYLIVLLQDADLREQFGRAARDRILREFDLEHRTRILERIYATVSRSGSVPGEDDERWPDSVVSSYSQFSSSQFC